MPETNKLLVMLRELLEAADKIEVTKGARAWRLNDPELPLKVGVTVVRARLAALLEEETPNA